MLYMKLSKKENKYKNEYDQYNLKQRLIFCFLSCLFGFLTIVIAGFSSKDEKMNILVFYVYIIIGYIISKVFNRILQFILIKTQVFKYVPDDGVIKYPYADKVDQKYREKYNVEYKQEMDRYLAGKCYMYSIMIAFFVMSLMEKEGIITSIFVSFILTLPFLFISYKGEPIEHAVGGNVNIYKNNNDNNNQHETKKSKPFFKTVHYTDQFGNYKGSSTTYDWGGGIKTTEFKNGSGQKTGEINSINLFGDDDK